MTSAHILYIPTIFLLGLIVGSLIRSQNQLPVTNDEKQSSKRGMRVSGRVLLSSFLVFVLVFIGTHFFEIPRSSKAVVKALNGQEIFDKKPSFSQEEVYARISNFPENGIQLYKQFTYTIDVLFPLTFFSFLFLLALYAKERSGTNSNFKLLLLLFPFLWFISDMIENASIFHLLSILPRENIQLGGVLGYITIAKFILLLLSILAPAMAIVTSSLRNKV